MAGRVKNEKNKEMRSRGMPTKKFTIPIILYFVIS
jgi:hypothetical protein